jgi:hypothetical protein
VAKGQGSAENMMRKKWTIIAGATLIALALFVVLPMRALYLLRLNVRRARSSVESHESFRTRMARGNLNMTADELQKTVGLPDLLLTNTTPEEWMYIWQKDSGVLNMHQEFDFFSFFVSSNLVVDSSLMRKRQDGQTHSSRGLLE